MGNSNTHATSRLLGKLLRAESKEVGVILTYGLGVSLLSLAVPIGIQTLVNTVAFGSVSQPMVFLVLAVFAGLAVAALFRALQVLLIEKLQNRFFAYIALELAARLPKVRIDRLSGARFPELVNRFFDVLTVQKSTGTLLLEGFALILQAILGLVLLALYHPILMAFDFVLIAGTVAIIFGLGRGAVNSCIEESVQKYRVAAWLEEMAAKSTSFRTTESRVMALKRTDELVVGYLKARRSHFRILLRQVIGSLGLQATASAMLLGLGALLVIRHQLTLGQLVAAEIVVTNVLNSLAKFQKHLEAFYDLATALDKIEGLMELPLESDSSLSQDKKTGPAKLVLRGVEYAYDHSRFSLKSLTREFSAGTKVALQGVNGSGKSTLVDLLFGMKRPSAGTLLLDDIDYREVGGEELRKHVALVRGVEIISGSVLENVAFGRTELSLSQVKDALESVGLREEILRLPDGANTVLGENGAPLSIAHAHRLMLARAIIGRPRLLLIDESLDTLDNHSVAPILEMLFSESAPWTLVLCTQDPEIAKRCDEILALDPATHGRAA